MEQTSCTRTTFSPWLFRYALFTALATLALLGIGGMVTSKGAGMAVPDWPTSYGYNMFLLPISYWVGGIFYEHSHRLLASFVGLLTVMLTRWVGGQPSQRWLGIVGALELAGGLALPLFAPDLRSTAHFLAGIGGVVLLAAAIPGRNAPAPKPLPALAWIAFFTVQMQGLLGGLRVVLLKDEVGVFHAALAQVFFVLVCAIALLTSGWWRNLAQDVISNIPKPSASSVSVLRLAVVAAVLIFSQLLLGAAMRHRHAGLAVPDFPAAYGRLWPKTDSRSIESYNRSRIEVFAAKPITAIDVNLHMAHRVGALAILAFIAAAAIKAARTYGTKGHGAAGIGWVVLVLTQASLGAATIWTNKAADIATAHLLIGAVTLAYGALWCIVLFVSLGVVKSIPRQMSREEADPLGNPSMANGEI